MFYFTFKPERLSLHLFVPHHWEPPSETSPLELCSRCLPQGHRGGRRVRLSAAVLLADVGHHGTLSLTDLHEDVAALSTPAFSLNFKCELRKEHAAAAPFHLRFSALLEGISVVAVQLRDRNSSVFPLILSSVWCLSASSSEDCNP